MQQKKTKTSPNKARAKSASTTRRPKAKSAALIKKAAPATPNQGNIENFSEFQKQADTFNNSLQNFIASNTNSGQWNENYSQGAKEFSNMQNSFGAFTKSCLDALTDGFMGTTHYLTASQNLNHKYYNTCAGITEKSARETTATTQESFSCRTLDQYLGWLQQHTQNTRNNYSDYLNTAMDNSIRHHREVYQTASKDAHNCQNRIWQAWTKYMNSCLGF